MITGIICLFCTLWALYGTIVLGLYSGLHAIDPSDMDYFLAVLYGPFTHTYLHFD